MSLVAAMILLDANVLIYAVNEDAPQHTMSAALIRAALNGQVPGLLAPQVLLECYSVITNGRRVSHPLLPEQAAQVLGTLAAALPVLETSASAFTTLVELIGRHRPIGAAVFDLFLVAQMQSQGVRSIATYNSADFLGVEGIEALSPEAALRRYGIG